MRIIVIGGGVSGHLVKLRIPDSTVLDSRSEATPMTRQYGGNYLWEPLAGIDCRSFMVTTMVDGQPPTEDSVRAYKAKIGKGMDANWREQFTPEMRGFEIARWPRDIEIIYDASVKYIDMAEHKIYIQRKAGDMQGEVESTTYDVAISTIPLPALISMAFMPKLELKYAPIHITTAPLPPDTARRDGWIVNYISDPDVPAYRTTDRDGTRHYESLINTGIPNKRIFPGKIWPHPHVLSVLEELEESQIFCFGRFARWAPEELVHETDAAIRAWGKSYGVIA